MLIAFLGYNFNSVGFLLIVFKLLKLLMKKVGFSKLTKIISMLIIGYSNEINKRVSSDDKIS